MNERFAARLRKAVAEAGGRAPLEALRYRRAVGPDGAGSPGDGAPPVAGAVLAGDAVLVLDPAGAPGGRLTPETVVAALRFGRAAGAVWAVTWASCPADDDVLLDLAFVRLAE